MVKKRGSSAMMVETILLIGFIIASMVVAYYWAKNRAETDTKNVVAGLASNLECAGIKIAYSCDDNNLNINNTGLHSIKKLLIRETKGNELYEMLEIELKPKGSLSLNENYISYDSNKEYGIVPLVAAELSNKTYMCKEKGIIVKC